MAAVLLLLPRRAATGLSAIEAEVWAECISVKLLMVMPPWYVTQVDHAFATDAALMKDILFRQMIT